MPGLFEEEVSPESNWVVIRSSKHFESYKKTMQQVGVQRDDLSRPVATVYEYYYRHIGDPRGYPCLVKTHFFKAEKKTTSPGKVRVDQKCYHHVVYPREAKMLLEAALRPHEPDPEDREQPCF